MELWKDIGNMWGRGMPKPPVRQHSLGNTSMDVQKRDYTMRFQGSAVASLRLASRAVESSTSAPCRTAHPCILCKPYVALADEPCISGEEYPYAGVLLRVNREAYPCGARMI